MQSAIAAAFRFDAHELCLKGIDLFCREVVPGAVLLPDRRNHSVLGQGDNAQGAH
jgi:hypothetical protein